MSKEEKKLSRKEVQQQLDNIIKEFQKKRFKTLKDKIDAESKPKNKKDLHPLQEAIDYLRVCVKYSLYDLEATRREVESCKKLLKDNGIET